MEGCGEGYLSGSAIAYLGPEGGLDERRVILLQVLDGPQLVPRLVHAPLRAVPDLPPTKPAIPCCRRGGGLVAREWECFRLFTAASGRLGLKAA